MAFEFLSGVVGTALGEVLSKILPPRKEGEFSDIHPETLQQRNKWLYRGILLAFLVGLAVPILLFIPIDENRALWGFEAIVDLPFSSVAIYLALIRLGLGSARTQELLFYEHKVRTHIYVCSPLHRCSHHLLALSNRLRSDGATN